MQTAIPFSPYILVVEDDTLLRESVVEVLQEEGFAAISLPDGASALNYLRESPPPAMILLDLGLPHLDGWEVRRQLLQDHRLADVPVVVCSGAEADAEDWLELAATDYVAKPLDADRLLRLAQRYCKRDRAAEHRELAW